jgi:cytochrome c
MKHLALLFTVAIAAMATGTSALAQYLPKTFNLIEAEQVAGRKLFSDHCGVCHTQVAGVRAYGPSLNGVAGRPAGSTSGFPYSDALKTSGVTWTDENLRKWIADPSHMVPGTLMPHPAIPDEAERIYLVAYLKTLKAPARR